MRKIRFLQLLAAGVTVITLSAALGYMISSRLFAPEEPAQNLPLSVPIGDGGDESVREASPEANDAPVQTQEQQANTPPMRALYGEESSGGEEAAYETDFEMPAHRYVLSVFNGYVAVFNALDTPDTFTPDDLSVMEVTATPASALSAEERQRLTTGIRITDDEQLARILQDYGS